VLDSKPRDWSHEQIETLQSLAAAVMAWIAERSEAAQSSTQHGQASHNNVDDHDTLQPTGEALFQAASELIESLDAYDACISAPTGDTGLLAREAEARARVIQAEQKLDATNQSLASSSESETNASTDKQHWAPLELLRASREYFTSKARREDAVLRFQRGEVGVDTVDQEVLRTSSAEQGLRLAVRAYALEHGE
jgi:pyruvate kinase